ncbi:hypothetical protein [Teredinibacter haidensis]|uniref:hypothetical protein n=1 Tax=Teredinibacter haidensis TaxID=2731755 RepID=UPI000948A952|nr:hypothetical protein [Teredinibacter haidensis]
MRYLCSRHQKVLVSDRAQSAALWQGAMSNGCTARRDLNLRLARSFFGSAFEIALLHVHQTGEGDAYFNRNNLILAGANLCEVLMDLGLSEEAQGCQQLLQEYLFIAAGDTTLPQEEREQAMATFRQLASEFVFLQSRERNRASICSGSNEDSLH